MSDRWLHTCANCMNEFPAGEVCLDVDGHLVCYRCWGKPVQQAAITVPERHSQSEALDAEMSTEELVAYYGFSSVHEMRKAIGATE